MSFWNWGSSVNQDDILQINQRLDKILSILEHKDIPYTPCQTPALPTLKIAPNTIKEDFNKELNERIKELRGNMGASHGF